MSVKACEHGNVQCAECTSQAVMVAVAEANRLHQQWKEDVTNQAHDWANDNNLCSTFDEFMATIGLRRRERDWKVRTKVVMYVDVEVTAEDETAAERKVTRSDVTAEIGHALECGDFDYGVEHVEEA
jgi:hypothetical protein